MIRWALCLSSQTLRTVPRILNRKNGDLRLQMIPRRSMSPESPEAKTSEDLSKPTRVTVKAGHETEVPVDHLVGGSRSRYNTCYVTVWTKADGQWWCIHQNRGIRPHGGLLIKPDHLRTKRETSGPPDLTYDPESPFVRASVFYGPMSSPRRTEVSARSVGVRRI